MNRLLMSLETIGWRVAFMLRKRRVAARKRGVAEYLKGVPPWLQMESIMERLIYGDNIAYPPETPIKRNRANL